MTQRFVNNYFTTVAATFGAADTFLQVASTAGLPTLAAGEYLLLTVFKKVGVIESAHEVVKVTGIVANQLTVQRGIEGAAPSMFLTGDRVEARFTAAGADNLVQQGELAAHATDNNNPHNTTAAQVGADPTGTAATAIGAHTGAADPHPQYATPAEAAAAAPVQSVAGRTGAVVLLKSDVGLGNVDNTSDLAKPVSTATQTALNGKSDTGHAHSAASTSVAGFMSAADKIKLDGIAAGATVYSHPANHPASIITQDASNRFVTDAEKAAWNAKQAALVSGTNIKTVGGVSLLGGGNVELPASSPFVAGDIQSTTNPLASPEWLECNGSEYLASSFPSLVGKIKPGIAAWNTDSYSRPVSRTCMEMAYGSGIFVLPGYNTSTVAISSDGQVWQEYNLPSVKNWRSIAFGNGVFVVIATGTDQCAISSDGINWTAQTLPESNSWTQVIFAKNMFVAITGSTNVYATSPDGMVWTYRQLPTTTNWIGIAFGSGIFTVVSSTGVISATSYDGIKWVQRTVSEGIGASALSYCNDMFILVGQGSPKILVSYDGLTWSSRLLPQNSGWKRAIYAEGVYVLTKSANQMAISLDGNSWSPVSMPSNLDWSCIQYGAGRFVVAASFSTSVVIYNHFDTSKIKVPFLRNTDPKVKTYIKS